MGCFLGCFGGAKESKPNRKQRVNRGSPHRQRNRVQKVPQEVVANVEQVVKEKPKTDLLSEFLSKAEEEKKGLSPSPRKRVTFDSNVTTYEHVPIHESVDSLPDDTLTLFEQEISKLLPSQSHSLSEDSNPSVASSVASYPPNHRYHSARYSDEDEVEGYGDSDFDDDVDDEFSDEDDFDDDDGDGDDVLSESSLTESMESKTGNWSLQTANEEVGSKARARSDYYISSVLNPVENLTQWKAAKARGRHSSSLYYPQKENLASNIEVVPCVSRTTEQTPKSKSDQTKSSSDQEISVDASLSTWLVCPETTTTSKRSGATCKQTISGLSLEDRLILGALTVEELRKISVSNSPRKSPPSPSPDEMPIIGTVGTYWKPYHRNF